MENVYVAKTARLPFSAVEQIGKHNFKNHLMKKLLKSGKVAKEDLRKESEAMLRRANMFFADLASLEESTGLSISADYPPNEGHFAKIPAADLALVMIEALFKDFGSDSAKVREMIDCFFLGTVISHKIERTAAHAFAKTIALRGGMRRANSLTEDDACNSALKALALAYDAVALKGAKFAVAGGVEKMDGVPDSFVRLGLTNPVPGPDFGKLMAGLADKVAGENGLDRALLDEYAYGSHERAVLWQGRHRFIAPVRVSDSLTVERDENVDKYKVNEIFRKFLANIPTYPESEEDGAPMCKLVSPGNSAKYASGGGLLLLTNDEGLKELGADPLAKILGYFETSNDEPKNFLLEPEKAIGEGLSALGLSWKDLGLLEVNEAFAVGNVLLMMMHDIPRDRMNRGGGSIARGHAIGGTLGANTSIAIDISLQDKDEYYAVAACHAVDEGGAMFFKNPYA